MSKLHQHLHELTETLTPIHSSESSSSARLPTYAQFSSVVRKSLDATSPTSGTYSTEDVGLALETLADVAGLAPRSNIYAYPVEDDRLIDNLELLRAMKCVSVHIALDRGQTVFQINEIVSGTVTLQNTSRKAVNVNVVYIQLQGWIVDFKFLSMVDLSPQTTSAITLEQLETRKFEFKFKIPEQKILIDDLIPLHANIYPSWESTDLESTNLGVSILYQITCHVVGLDHIGANEYSIMGENTNPIWLNALYPPLELFLELEYNQAVCEKLKTHLVWINKQNIEKWTDNLVLQPSKIDLKLFSVPEFITLRHVSPLHPVPTQKVRIPITVYEGKLYDKAKVDLIAVTVKSTSHIPIVLTHSLFFKQLFSSQTDYNVLVASPLKHFVSKVNKIGSHFQGEEILALLNDTTPAQKFSLSNLIVDNELSATLETLINLRVTYTTLPTIHPQIIPTKNGFDVEFNTKFLHVKGKDIAIATNRFGMEGFQLILDFQGCHAARLYYLSLELSYASKFLVHLYVPVKIM